MSKKKHLNKQSVKLKTVLLLLAVILLCLIILLTLLPSNKGYTSSSKTLNKAETEKANTKTDIHSEKGTGNLIEKQRVESEKSSVYSPEGGKKEHPKAPAKLVFIIDDAGYSLKQVEPFLNFPGKITISVLPDLKYSRAIAEKAKEKGRGIILHCPMEPVNGENPGPNAIYVGQSREEIRRILKDDFNSVPGAEGTNNHMGSRATSDKKTMDMVMEYLAENHKYFIDSKTTSESIAEAEAKKYNVPYFSRDIFIDNNSEKDRIKGWIEKGIAIAERKGYAILIGHVKSPQIIGILNSLSGVLKEKGIKLATIDELKNEYKVEK